jgi:hypothetical protein
MTDLTNPVEIPDAVRAARDARLAANPRFVEVKTGAGFIVPTSAPRRQPEPLTPDEAKLIANLERVKGRKLREGEALLALDQARAVGQL